MSEDRPKRVYAPASLKEITFSGGGTLLKLSVNVDKFLAFLKEHENEKGWVNMKIERKKEVGQYGDTHSLQLDTWKPDGQGGGRTHETTTRPAQRPAAPLDDSDIPF
jgi:hypothetical protein